MTPLEALLELLERVGAGNGAALVNEEELSRWPEPAVQALKLAKLLVKASPATTVVCPGCEQECTMPVHTVSAKPGEAASFVVCDKRDDINRVPGFAQKRRFAQKVRKPAQKVRYPISQLPSTAVDSEDSHTHLFLEEAMRLLQSPDYPILSPSLCVRSAWNYSIVDHRFDGIEECPDLMLKIGQTIGEAVDLSESTCKWCEIIRSDPTPYFNECSHHLALGSEHPEENTHDGHRT